MIRTLSFSLLLALLALPAAAVPAAAQDVELLGEVYGTRPPDGYFLEVQRDPAAFRFQREGLERLEAIQTALGRDLRHQVLMRADEARSLGPRHEPVVGTFHFPVVLGLYSDSPPGAAPFDRDRVQAEFFDGPNSYHQTIPELYGEMSRGLVALEGTTSDWVRSPLTREQVTQGHSGLVSHPTHGVGGFIESILEELDAQGVDWSAFDHTGDGFVDVLAVIHPVHGAECGGESGARNLRIWSHRWNLRSATQHRLNPGFRTSTPRPGGDGFIYVNDYTIQPVLACNAESINEIGVFAHELGHGFGLPDLYATGGQSHRGIGNWGLMGTGSWGCQGADPSRPCHMTAWSKAMLGWLDIEEMEPGMDHGPLTLEPVQSSGRALRISSGDGAREYLLLENRQRIGSDVHLYEPGLLIWHIDQDVVDTRWFSNSINNDPGRMGVWLRQADGRNRLAEAGPRGDPGDPFPGCIKESIFDHGDPTIPCQTNHEFHAGRAPLSVSHQGTAMGITLTDIQLEGTEPHDVSFRLSTRFSRISLAVEDDGEAAAASGFTVDGVERSGDAAVTFESAPFQSHELIAGLGLEIEDGVRSGFLGWTDGAQRARSFTTPLADTTLVALYGGREIRVEVSTESPADGITPGEVELSPERDDHWFPEGTEVTVKAQPRQGFSFREWLGVLEGSPNPTTLTLSEPLAVGAAFDVTYDFATPAEDLDLEAAVLHELTFPVEDANEPVTWTIAEGTLPVGFSFSSDRGVLEGAAMELGTFPVTVRALDGIGLEARASLVLRVHRPMVGMDRLTGPFLGTGEEPTSPQREFLDRHGNRNGVYDIGDLRSFLTEAGGQPATAAARELVRKAIPLRMVPDGGEERRE